MELMEIYATVFNPIYYMLFCALIVVYHDAKKTGQLMKGVVVTLTAYMIAYATYSTWYFLPPAPQWVEDFLAVSGLMLGVLIAVLALRKKIFDGIIREAIYIIVALSIPYMAISPFWNISGHVAYTTAPTLYLISLDRRFTLLIVIPLIMVVNRPVVGAHTVAQSIAGFLLAAIIVLIGTYRYGHGYA